MQGKILIVNKLDGSVFGWFGEVMINDESRRPDIENILLVELESNQNQKEFMNLTNGIESVKVIDIKNKILEFELKHENIETEEQRLQRELLEAQNQIVNLEFEKLTGCI
ncbi:hypothetical protein GCM10008905_02720 [Clostridium malenominatum]|uniref:Uncharacterized protein n=1 Tax=Clostridium malenominatum TaxID=1539 RepID=A0ABP3TWW7_9CLOT